MEGYGGIAASLDTGYSADEGAKAKRKVDPSADPQQYLEVYYKPWLKLSRLERLLLRCPNLEPSPVPLRLPSAYRRRPKASLRPLIVEDDIHSIILVEHCVKAADLFELVAAHHNRPLQLHLHRRLPLPPAGGDPKLCSLFPAACIVIYISFKYEQRDHTSREGS